jgi:hypothetical protein
MFCRCDLLINEILFGFILFLFCLDIVIGTCCHVTMNVSCFGIRQRATLFICACSPHTFTSAAKQIKLTNSINLEVFKLSNRTDLGMFPRLNKRYFVVLGRHAA